MAITTAIQKLEASSEESIDNGQPHAMPGAFAPGDIYWQGDVGLLMLEELPQNAVQDEARWSADYQLADGNSRGSRHCIPLRFESSTAVYSAETGDVLDGPVIKAEKPFDLVHPEHADHLGYPAGIYRVRHQQNAQRERVLD